MIKKVFTIILAVFIVTFSSGCSSALKMPFNGDIEFHRIALTIPERFVRDSTQSTDDFLVFEHGNYSKYILVSRKDIVEDVSTSLENYIEYMKEIGAESEKVSFLNNDAVFSTYYIDDVFCQEILFRYDNSFYSIALRGGTENDFKEISDTVKLIEFNDKSAS